MGQKPDDRAGEGGEEGMAGGQAEAASGIHSCEECDCESSRAMQLGLEGHGSWMRDRACSHAHGTF